MMLIIKCVRWTIKLLARAPGNLKARFRGVRIGSGSKIEWGAKVVRARNAVVVIGKDCKVHSTAIIAPHPNGSILIGNNLLDKSLLRDLWSWRPTYR